MSSDDDDDYMSANFMEKLEQSDVRPGLVFSSKTARLNELERRKRDADVANRTDSKKIKPNLKEALQTPIDKSNKGFALLAKMGFKEGSGLGKTGDGIKDPVPLSMKTDRTGLGTETIRNEKKQKAEKMLTEMRGMRAKAMQMQREHFKNEKQLQFYERRLFGVLRVSQRVCFQLDSQKGLTDPVDEFFWPSSERETEEENEDETEVDERQDSSDYRDRSETPVDGDDDYLDFFELSGERYLRKNSNILKTERP